MDSFLAEVRICAAPGAVWEVITDAAAYTEWDSGIAGVSGDLGHGRYVRLRAGDGGGSVQVEVVRYGASAMSWTVRLPGGLFKAVRTISISSGNGKTRLAVRDVFTGPLWYLIRRFMPDLAVSSSRFAAGVRVRAEKLSGNT